MDKQSLQTFAARLAINLRQEVSRDGWITAPCPLAQWTHASKKDTNPSFGLHINPGGLSAYNCYACHRHGSLAKLVWELGRYRGINYAGIAHEIELTEALGDDQTLPEWKEELYDEEQSIAEAAAIEGIFPSAYDWPLAARYLAQRRITPLTASYLGLKYDGRRGRVLFPVYDKEWRFRGYSGRAIELHDPIPQWIARQWLSVEKSNRVKIRDYAGLPKVQLLLGEHRVSRRARFVVVVEGLFAYARLQQFHVANVVALLGSFLTPQKAETLIDWGLPTIWLTDNDKAGQEAIYGTFDDDGNLKNPGAIQLLSGKVPVLIPKWPDGIDDPDFLPYANVCSMLRTAELYA